MNARDMKWNRIKLVICFSLAFLFASTDTVAQNIKTRADLDKKSLKNYKSAIAEGRRKKYEKSLKLFEKILKKHPEFIDAQLRKAGMLHNMKKYEQSAIEF